MGNACCTESGALGASNDQLLKTESKRVKVIDDHEKIIMAQIKQIQKSQWVESEQNISNDKTADFKAEANFKGTITDEKDTLAHLNQMNAYFFSLNEHQTMSLINNPQIEFSRPRLEYEYAEGLPVKRIVTDSYKYIGQVKEVNGPNHAYLLSWFLCKKCRMQARHLLLNSKSKVGRARKSRR